MEKSQLLPRDMSTALSMGYTYNTPTNVFLNYMDGEEETENFEFRERALASIGFNNGNCDEVFHGDYY